VGTQDSIAIPLLILVLFGLVALGIHSWCRLKQGKPLLPSAKRRLTSFVLIVVWISAVGVASHAIPFLVIVIIAMPASAIVSWYRLKQGKPLPSKRARYSGGIVFLFVLLIFAVGAASREQIVLFPSNLPTPREWSGGGIVLAAILVRVYCGWRRLSGERKQALLRVLPENGSELWIWAAVSLLAGVAEECVYRGVAYHLLWQMTGSVACALAICVVAFGVLHAIYGWKAATEVGLFGLFFHITVALTGTLYLAIGMHITYDFLLGVLVMRLLNRDKFEAEQMTQPASLVQL
jgi:membrane protease YdiL (CAAX protease family)